MWGWGYKILKIKRNSKKEEKLYIQILKEYLKCMIQKIYLIQYKIEFEKRRKINHVIYIIFIDCLLISMEKTNYNDL